MGIRCRQHFAWACAALLVSGATHADIYVSYAGATPRFATQKLDESYELYLKTDATETRAPVFAPASKIRAPSPELKARIAAAAARHQIDPMLFDALVWVESRYNPTALSPKGAAGYTQLMPATAARYGVKNRFDPEQNLDGGARYLRDLLLQYKGNAALALSAYNAGEGAVDRRGKRVPPYPETMLYVPAVLTRAEEIRAADRAANPQTLPETARTP